MNLKSIMLREDSHKWPHTVWLYLHEILVKNWWKANQWGTRGGEMGLNEKGKEF